MFIDGTRKVGDFAARRPAATTQTTKSRGNQCVSIGENGVDNRSCLQPLVRAGLPKPVR
jgi:hypothetical protein